jgi:hypothetical protein
LANTKTSRLAFIGSHLPPLEQEEEEFMNIVVAEQLLLKTNTREELKLCPNPFSTSNV